MASGPDPARAPFGEVSAAIYDATYADKDYEGECNLLEAAFARHGEPGIHEVLDLGCGSGGHLLPLARRGYGLVGVDASESMLENARTKTAEATLGAVELREGDVRSVRLGRTFDAVLLMFAVLGYQGSNEDVLGTLRTVRAHLRSGGLLCFDAWYGPGVLAIKPEERGRTVDTPDGPIARTATPELDVRRHVCTVHYRFEDLRRATQLAQEDHVMRFFFPMELELFLSEADLELLSLTRFGSLDEEPDSATWSVFGVARAAPGEQARRARSGPRSGARR